MKNVIKCVHSTQQVTVRDLEGVRGVCVCGGGGGALEPPLRQNILFSWRIFRKSGKVDKNSGKTNKSNPTPWMTLLYFYRFCLD